MAETQKLDTTKVRNLITRFRELHDQQQAILEELDTLLAGGPGIGEVLKRIQAHYSDAWRVRYRSPYSFQFQKDVPHMKRLIKQLGVEELEMRIVSYLRNGDPYYVRARHPFGLFVSTINQHASAGDAGGELELELENEAAATIEMLENRRK